jgi:hypothetical protein
MINENYRNENYLIQIAGSGILTKIACEILKSLNENKN